MIVDYIIIQSIHDSTQSAYVRQSSKGAVTSWGEHKTIPPYCRASQRKHSAR